MNITMSKVSNKATSLTLALFLAASALVFMPTSASAATNVNDSSTVRSLFSSLNKQRASKGVPSVKYNTNIASVSRDWAVKMADKNNVSPNPNYDSDKRISQDWWNISEIIGYSDSGSVSSIMNSINGNSANREIALDRTYTHIGIGTAKSKSGTTYFVVDFFKYDTDPAGTQSAPSAPKIYVSGEIAKKYNSSNVKEKLGNPTAKQVRISSGYMQKFQRGEIYYKKSRGATVLYKSTSISSKYKKLGTAKGSLGFPVSDERKLKKGAYQKFEKGNIYWSSKTGTHVVKKGTAISKKWAKSKYENGSLGYPASSELKKTKATSYQKFQNGTIYYSKKTGAHIVKSKSAIKKQWDKRGSVKGSLGLPKSDEKKLKKHSGMYQKFNKGKIYWSKNSKAHTVYNGAINNKWGKSKFEKGKLGYPTSNQYKSKGKTWQKFQGGKISYSKKSGAKVYYKKR